MTNTEISGLAYAKVNFTLEILNRRPDGYHEIRSIMQTVSLADTIRISCGLGNSGIILRVEGPFAEEVPADSTNLVHKAVRSILARAGVSEGQAGVDITLTKAIPSQAGLGGGSSDAATALLLTNRLFDLGLSHADLAALAQQLGSDVSFFLTGGTARVEGLGEHVTGLPHNAPSPLYARYIVIYKPPANISTAAAYRALDEHRAVRIETGVNITALWETAFLSGAPLSLSNDFLPVILSDNPAIARIHAQLSAIARGCGVFAPMLTGSGSAFYCIAPDEARAVAVQREIAQLDEKAQVWIAQPVKPYTKE